MGASIGRVLGSIALAAMGASATQAASIDIEGVWGNREGCRAVRGADSNGSMLILRRDKIEGAEFQCDFLSAKRGSDGSHTVRADCAQEGVETIVQIRIGAERKGVRTFKANQGWHFDPVSKCR